MKNLKNAKRCKKIVLAIMLGILVAFSVTACTTVNYASETENVLDPMGYAKSGYYGKSPEELKKILPEIHYGASPSMVLESKLSPSLNCKQIFYFANNKLVEITYVYYFDSGEEAEERFVEQCQRLSEIDKEAQPLWCARFVGDIEIITKVDEIETGFWDEMIELTEYYPKKIGYTTYCDEKNSRTVNREAEPEGWKNEYNIKIEAEFYHIDIDWETGERKESDAEFLNGKEARIILTIGTWD